MTLIPPSEDQDGMTGEPTSSPKHLLDVDSLSRDQITELIESAESHRRRIMAGDAKSSVLYGKSIYTLFFEDSTRTRVSFEQAGKWLGADVINVSASASSVNKGESLLNTVKTLNAIGADFLVIRHPHSGAPHFAARHSDATVINAGDGMHAHPTQALLDVMTLQQRIGSLVAKKVAIVGDIMHSRVARSTIQAFATMGARVAIGGPRTLLPKDWIQAEEFAPWGNQESLEIHTVQSSCIRRADAVMALRLQRERQSSGLLPDIREYSSIWGISSQTMSQAKQGAFLMHPGPMNEGIEVTTEAAHGPRSLITDQVTNGVAMRMAVLEWFSKGRRML